MPDSDFDEYDDYDEEELEAAYAAENSRAAGGRARAHDERTERGHEPRDLGAEDDDEYDDVDGDYDDGLGPEHFADDVEDPRVRAAVPAPRRERDAHLDEDCDTEPAAHSGAEHPDNAPVSREHRDAERRDAEHRDAEHFDGEHFDGEEFDAERRYDAEDGDPAQRARRPRGGPARPYRPGRGGFDPEVAELTARARYSFRQRVVVVMLLSAVGTGLAAGLTMPTLWWAHGALDLALVGYLAYLRRQVRIEDGIRQRRMARLASTRERPAPAVDRSSAAPSRVVEQQHVVRTPPAAVRHPGAAKVELDDEDPVFDELAEPAQVSYRRAVGE